MTFRAERPADEAATRQPHRHDLADPACREATAAELRRALTAAQATASALELAGDQGETELRLVLRVLDRLHVRICQLEASET